MDIEIDPTAILIIAGGILAIYLGVKYITYTYENKDIITQRICTNYTIKCYNEWTSIMMAGKVPVVQHHKRYVNCAEEPYEKEEEICTNYKTIKVNISEEK